MKEPKSKNQAMFSLLCVISFRILLGALMDTQYKFPKTLPVGKCYSCALARDASGINAWNILLKVDKPPFS